MLLIGPKGQPQCPVNVCRSWRDSSEQPGTIRTWRRRSEELHPLQRLVALRHLPVDPGRWVQCRLRGVERDQLVPKRNESRGIQAAGEVGIKDRQDRACCSGGKGQRLEHDTHAVRCVDLKTAMAWAPLVGSIAVTRGPRGVSPAPVGASECSAAQLTLPQILNPHPNAPPRKCCPVICLALHLTHRSPASS